MYRSFYGFVTIHACVRQTDRQTDGRTEFSSQYRVFITCSAVKTKFIKTVIGDVVAHLKPQKFSRLVCTVSSLMSQPTTPCGSYMKTRNTFCETWYLPHSIWPRWTNCSYNYERMYDACTNRLYFHFRSKIWRHHRVPRPRFPECRENYGDSRTFKADIRLLNICMRFQDLLP